MYFFVVFSFDVDDIGSFNHPEVNSELEELGLRFLIKPSDEQDPMNLPQHTYIGEYKYRDKTELRNMLYGEIQRMFSEHDITGTIFLSVSENALIGVDYIG